MGKSKKRTRGKIEQEGPSGKLKKLDNTEDLMKENDKVALSLGSSKKKSKRKKKQNSGVSNLQEPTIADDERLSTQTEPMEFSQQITEMAIQPNIHIDLNRLFASDGLRSNGSHLHCNDIKNLLLFTVLGNGRWESPKWCNLVSWKNVNKTLFIMVKCVSAEDFVVFKDCFKRISSIFPVGYPIKNDGGEGQFISPLQSYLNYNMKKKSAKRKGKNGEAKNLLPSELVLSKEQRLVNEFPVLERKEDFDSVDEEDDDWVSTEINFKSSHDTALDSNNSCMFAIDCEMCLSSNGKELTRISIVNENLEVVYDTYVKPKAHITDYLTQYSGITPEHLKNVKTTLGDVQQKLLQIISPNDIIVGHSLENDMRVLKIYHDNYIDTSVAYGDQRGARFKPSLKHLVKLYLRKEIQIGEHGHCSIEDAKACMELVKLKLEKGSQFGVFNKPSESIFEAFSRVEKKSVIVDTACIARQHCFSLTKGILCNSDEEVLKGTVNSIGMSDFVFADLKDFEKLLKGADSAGKKPDSSQIKETLTRIDEHVALMMESVPSNCLVVCLFASGFIPKHVQSMQRDKKNRRAVEVVSAIRKARDSVCFLKVKE